MASYAEANGIDYPIAIDVEEATQTAFAVDSFPDYYLIDRSGKLRVADLSNTDLERAVQVLLSEDVALPVAPVLAAAARAATAKDKRILAVWGTEAEQAHYGQLAASDPGVRKLIFNEYEVVQLDRAGHADLAERLQAGPSGLALTVLDSKGAFLARLDAREAAAESLGKFLESNRVPQKDAEVLWTRALERATRENKRVLVHLGAPW